MQIKNRLLHEDGFFKEVAQRLFNLCKFGRF
jgi:hypothetical protein